ncbi:MAG: hypothetical protein JWQ53_828 [Klenkia sp.]|nr:hypothetical protein [Klenkia sp.]
MGTEDLLGGSAASAVSPSWRRSRAATPPRSPAATTSPPGRPTGGCPNGVGPTPRSTRRTPRATRAPSSTGRDGSGSTSGSPRRWPSGWWSRCRTTRTPPRPTGCPRTRCTRPSRGSRWSALAPGRRRPAPAAGGRVCAESGDGDPGHGRGDRVRRAVTGSAPPTERRCWVVRPRGPDHTRSQASPTSLRRGAPGWKTWAHRTGGWTTVLTGPNPFRRWIQVLGSPCSSSRPSVPRQRPARRRRGGRPGPPDRVRRGGPPTVSTR